MKRRGWRVGELAELPPARAGAVALWGDNLDRGRRVRLLVRQRKARGRASGDGAYRWIDEEQVFATMLHELTHNEIGPHDGRFYALLRTLEREAAVTMASDFVVCGRCVGGDGMARRARSPRTNARDAAARRARLAEVGLRGGGRRLGGAGGGGSRLLAAGGGGRRGGGGGRGGGRRRAHRSRLSRTPTARRRVERGPSRGAPLRAASVPSR